MNFLERLLLKQQADNDKKNNYGITPMQTPEQFAQNQQLDQQRQKLAENLQQTGSPIRAAQNFLIHPKNALFGIQSNNQEQPISYQQPLVGVDVTQQDYDNMSKQGLLPETPLISAGVKENPRTGGLLNDLTSGFRENSQNGFDVSNLENNTTDYGAKKGLGYKAGELLGTAARFGNSPMGRFALTAGLVGATGGSPLQAIAYGGNAGIRNQQLQTQDKMYRKALEDNGIDTSNISGYIDGDMYKNYTMGNYRMGRLSLAQIDQLRKAGLTEAQIRKLDADTDYIEGAKTDKTEAETGLIKEKTKTEPVIRETKLHPPVRKFVSTKNGHTVVDINHHSNGGSGSPQTSYKEGQTATNPKTGEKMIYKGGKWQKL